MTRTCAVCRTSLDEYPVTCEHGEVFCGGCCLEDGCDECAIRANVERLGDALTAAIKEARDVRTGPTLGPVARCLCGSSDTRPGILATPVDLTAEDVAAQRNEGGRPCRACHHYIHHGAMCVVRHYARTTTVRDHYHPECVEM